MKNSALIIAMLSVLLFASCKKEELPKCEKTQAEIQKSFKNKLKSN